MPLKTLDATKPAALLAALQAEIVELAIEEVIIGLPLKLDGTEGEGARRSHVLAKQVEAKANVRVVLWDERLTTVAAQRALREAGIKERDQRGKIDRAAATILLQSYLDSNTETSWDEDQMPPDVPRDNAGPRRKKGSWREER